MDHRITTRDRLEVRVGHWLAPRSVTLLRLSLGLVFLVFGVLKFVPGLSPAEDLVAQTLDGLTLGLVPEPLGLVLVATLETVIGLCLLTGRALRLGLALLAVALVGILSPLVLLSDQLFAGPFNAPTLAGQYVIKDVVLLAAALVVAASVLARRPVTERDERSSATHAAASGRRWEREDAAA
jgi:uncharacterized membrane protein YkgB